MSANRHRLVTVACVAQWSLVTRLHHVRHVFQVAGAALKPQARASPMLHGEATGWSEPLERGERVLLHARRGRHPLP